MKDRFLIGYARVSTDDQDLRLQIEALKRYGVPEDQIIQEKASGGRMDRKGLKRILKALRDRDVVVVWKLDRLGRSLAGVIDTVAEIEKRGANIVSLTEQIDTTTAMGRFFFHVIAAFGELERGLISERTKAGIKAKMLTDPTYRPGRKNLITDNDKRLKHLRKIYAAGSFSVEGQRLKGITAKDLMRELNAVDPAKDQKITNEETVRRWVRQGCIGLLTPVEK